MKTEIESVHINRINVGDTIVCNDGRIRTVAPTNIKSDPFMGRRLFGDSYRLGTIKVKRVRFITNMEAL